MSFVIVICYLANNTNLTKWGPKSFAKYGICDGNQTLGHVVGRCKTALDEKQYIWKHDSIQAVFSNFIKSAKTIKMHCETESYMNQSVITGAENRPDMIVTQNESTILVLELTVWFETKIDLNTKRKTNKYKEILKFLENKFEKLILST